MRNVRTSRLVHGEDMNPAGAFVVDPDTQHLYTAYGRGNIPQLERQKLMTGNATSHDTNNTHHTVRNHGRFLTRREPEKATDVPPDSSSI